VSVPGPSGPSCFCCPFKEKVIHRSCYVCLSIGPSFCHENLILVITSISNFSYLTLKLCCFWQHDTMMPNSLGQGHICQSFVSAVGMCWAISFFRIFIYRSPQRQLNKSIEVNLFNCLNVMDQNINEQSQIFTFQQSCSFCNILTCMDNYIGEFPIVMEAWFNA